MPRTGPKSQASPARSAPSLLTPRLPFSWFPPENGYEKTTLRFRLVVHSRMKFADCPHMSPVIYWVGEEVNPMSRKITYQYSGQCPKCNGPHSISITYAEIPIVGQSAPGYKKMSFTCDWSEDCLYMDEYGRCPVLLSAPDKPR